MSYSTADSICVYVMTDHQQKLSKILQSVDKHSSAYSFAALTIYLFINNTINATSVWMEATRNGETNMALWEPFVWEYSSMIAVLICLPGLLWIWNKFPFRFSNIKRQLAMHISASLLFSICHLALMITLRKFVYLTVEMQYQFGDLPREFIYEYRKDLWGYLLILLFYNISRFTLSRIRGEANLLDKSEADTSDHQINVPEHFLVKKLDREFLVSTKDISWLESNGNYVNLHAEGRTYPLRATLNELSEKLSGQFVRVHRSHAVNTHFIKDVSYKSSGDGEITLLDGELVPVSRRFKSNIVIGQ